MDFGDLIMRNGTDLGLGMGIGLAVLGACSVWAMPAGACPGDPAPAPPFLTTNEYRGVVEGDGVGFEAEVDEIVLDREILTALDIAHQLMRGEFSASGVGHYSADGIRESVLGAFETHLGDEPTDWYTMREYAMALMWDQQYERGLKMLAQSYAGDGALVRVRLDDRLFGEGRVGREQVKKLTVGLVRYAKANDSAIGWFGVSVILQSKGYLVHARTNLERAIAAGLDDSMGEALGDLMGRALSGKQ